MDFNRNPSVFVGVFSLSGVKHFATYVHSYFPNKKISKIFISAKDAWFYNVNIALSYFFVYLSFEKGCFLTA